MVGLCMYAEGRSDRIMDGLAVGKSLLVFSPGRKGALPSNCHCRRSFKLYFSSISPSNSGVRSYSA